MSFELRKRMVLNPNVHLLVSTVSGILIICPLITSLFILQTKFYSDNKEFFADAEPTELKYSDCLKPILVSLIIQVVLIIISLYGLLRDIIEQGIYVWNRDNFGHLF